MKHPSELPPAFRAPPAPGITNAMCSPWPYTEWHYIVRVDENRWCLVNHSHTLGTVGDAQTIAEALAHLPIAQRLLERTPRPPSPLKIPTELENLDLDAIMKGLDL